MNNVCPGEIFSHPMLYILFNVRVYNWLSALIYDNYPIERDSRSFAHQNFILIKLAHKTVLNFLYSPETFTNRKLTREKQTFTRTLVRVKVRTEIESMTTFYLLIDLCVVHS